jgi:hypothetical protein
MCPLECNQTKFTKTTSEIHLMGDTVRDYINENRNLSMDFVNTPINAETARKSVPQIYVFYYSLSYTLSNEIPKMDIVSLLASIGGNLSLFMGVSFFSICEIVEFLIEAYFMVRDKNRKVKVEQEN